MIPPRALLLCLSLALSTLSALPAVAAQLTVFAAASLKEALEELAPLYQQQTGDTLRLSFAGSSALARQVEAGAPADLLILANAAWMDHLDDRGLLQPDSRVNLLGNRLVLVGAAGEAPLPLGPAILDRLGSERLAMALVQAVPAGIYGREALQSLGLWSELRLQVAQADNVRAALALVAMGEAPLGVVYQSDAQAEPRVAVLAAFPASSHAPITYPAAILADSRAAQADQLLDFLQSPIAKEVFLRHGFTEPPQ